MGLQPITMYRISEYKGKIHAFTGKKQIQMKVTMHDGVTITKQNEKKTVDDQNAVLLLYRGRA